MYLNQYELTPPEDNGNGHWCGLCDGNGHTFDKRLTFDQFKSKYPEFWAMLWDMAGEGHSEERVYEDFKESVKDFDEFVCLDCYGEGFIE